jgi:two-component system response regulator AtoC/two-component system nitrogen regulation response regulator NtrX
MLAPGQTLDEPQASFDKIPNALRPTLLALGRTLGEDSDLEASLDLYEKSLLTAALQRHASVANCCKALNVPRSTLDAKRRKHQI